MDKGGRNDLRSLDKVCPLKLIISDQKNSTVNVLMLYSHTHTEDV